MHVLEIEPYSTLKIDCFQNLILSLINQAGVDLRLLGCMWPWIFYKFDKNEIKNHFYINNEMLKNLFGYALKKDVITGDLVKHLADKSKTHPLIVNVDQFYIRHHYPDIYQKRHGEHSLMILDYEESSQLAQVVGVMPDFKGVLDFKELEIAIKSYADYFERPPEFYFLEKISDPSTNEADSFAFNCFMKSLNMILINTDTQLKVDVMDLVEMCHLFNNSKNALQNQNSCYTLLSKSRWYWEIDRPGIMFMAYMETNSFKRNMIPDNLQEIYLMTKDINKNISNSLKLIYKAFVSTNEKLFKERIDALTDVIYMEEKLKELIVHSIL